MISKNDCILLLTDLSNKGIDTKDQLKELMLNNQIPLPIIKFINDNRQLDLASFYEGIRKSYNQKNSNLYINIVKEIEDPTETLTTLSAMLTQILRYSKKVENKAMFLRHARAIDITKALNNYFNTFDITLCLKLLRVIKADIKALESIR
ncbi:hypothetical protein [uncultured Clostridium sp.]|uniref:hypothetical protein n=1 Tax=uncultured Clostridium sp. TaxID=59620 RepID=UPI0026258270|nr:hypothetical protein [uncultured Clostridium sp.]